MPCPLDICGGCLFRHLPLPVYQVQKKADFAKMLSGLEQKNVRLADPVFIGDNTRRRASLAFTYAKKNLTLGFNRRQSNDVVNIDHCHLLTSRLNANLFNIRELLKKICASPLAGKGKKARSAQPVYINKGDVWICDADNGIDIVLEFDSELSLEHRMLIFEAAQQYPDIIRISHRRSPVAAAEPIIEKTKPVVKMGGYDVFIPAGTFLQASKEGENALVSLVLKYLDGLEGQIADLFCGVGTFSYPLARNKNNRILAADSSVSLLSGFRRSVYKNMINNIEVIEKNLFKYPFTAKEVGNYDAVVFDPPRAGAATQIAEIANAPAKPKRIVAVSCNPYSFVKDANVLTGAGYQIEEITLVDQFCYSNHNELVALFTLKI